MLNNAVQIRIIYYWRGGSVQPYNLKKVVSTTSLGQNKIVLAIYQGATSFEV